MAPDDMNEMLMPGEYGVSRGYGMYESLSSYEEEEDGGVFCSMLHDGVRDHKQTATNSNGPRLSFAVASSSSVAGRSAISGSIKASAAPTIAGGLRR